MHSFGVLKGGMRGDLPHKNLLNQNGVTKRKRCCKYQLPGPRILEVIDPQTVTQNLTKEKSSFKQPLSVNYQPNPPRREEEAIVSLDKALTGRPRVKDMVERIRKETERDKIRQELVK